MAYVLRSRLNQGVNGVVRGCQLSGRYPFKVETQSRYFATKELVDEEVSQPTKFSTSRANSESAKHAREKVSKDETPWSQTISLALSLGAFLIYFGVLREPNDLDDEIERDIGDRVPDLKEVHEKLQTSAGRAVARRTL